MAEKMKVTAEMSKSLDKCSRLQVIWLAINELSNQVFENLRQNNAFATQVVLKVRSEDLNCGEYEISLDYPIQTAHTLGEITYELFTSRFDLHKPIIEITLIGISNFTF